MQPPLFLQGDPLPCSLPQRSKLTHKVSLPIRGREKLHRFPYHQPGQDLAECRVPQLNCFSFYVDILNTNFINLSQPLCHVSNTSASTMKRLDNISTKGKTVSSVGGVSCHEKVDGNGQQVKNNLTQEVPGPAGNRGKVSLVVQTCNINDTLLVCKYIIYFE